MLGNGDRGKSLVPPVVRGSVFVPSSRKRRDVKFGRARRSRELRVARSHLT